MHLGELGDGEVKDLYLFHLLLHPYAADFMQPLYRLCLSTCTTVITDCMCFYHSTSFQMFLAAFFFSQAFFEKLSIVEYALAMCISTESLGQGVL